MSRVRLLAITTANDTTTTSEPFRMGGRQIRHGEGGRAITTLLVTGVFGSGNGDTLQFQVSANSASGSYVQEHLDPLSILNHVDSSGDFAAAGAVNVESAPGLWGRFVFRAPSGTGDSSIEVWAHGAIELDSSTALTIR